MFKDKKVIIFDMDGTLIDSIGIWTETDRILIAEISNNPDFAPDDIRALRKSIWKEHNTGNLYLVWCEYLKEACKSTLTAEEIMQRRWEISDNFVCNEIKYKPFAAEVLHKLKDLGFTLALGTVTSAVQIDAYRNRNENIKSAAKLDEIFSLILSQDDVEKAKPDPEVYIKIMQKFNVKPEECLVFEDSLVGVQAANGAGIEVAVMYDKYSDEDRGHINFLSQYQFDGFEEVFKCLETELSNDE